jgi:hypothetical protein
MRRNRRVGFYVADRPPSQERAVQRQPLPLQRSRRLLDDVLRGDHTLVIGAPILGELEAVRVETCGCATDRAVAVRTELEATAEVVTPGEIPRVCWDPDDDQILAIAVIGTVDALVTGDADLLPLGAMAASTSRPSPTWRFWRGAEKGGPPRAHYAHQCAHRSNGLHHACTSRDSNRFPTKPP